MVFGKVFGTSRSFKLSHSLMTVFIKLGGFPLNKLYGSPFIYREEAEGTSSWERYSTVQL